MDQRTLIEQAWSIARNYHGAQMYGDVPYTVHLAEVFRQLKSFGITDQDVLIAGILHDVVEDTNCELLFVHSTFGIRVADIVGRVTNEPGKNRKARALATYPKIKAMTEAIIVKLADRISNVLSCRKSNPGLYKMYCDEYTQFRKELYVEGDAAWQMWNFLDRLMNFDPPPPSLL